MAFLDTDDLTAFASIPVDKAEQMIADAEALATLAAPCLATVPNTLTEAQVAAVKAVLRAVVLRWNESGTGARVQETIGDYSQTIETKQRRGLFWPSEITQLQAICSAGSSTGAFGIDTVLQTSTQHQDICALFFGALYCSCGAVLTLGLPLYEWGYTP